MKHKILLHWAVFFAYMWFAIWWYYHLSSVDWIKVGQIVSNSLIFITVFARAIWVSLEKLDL